MKRPASNRPAEPQADARPTARARWAARALSARWQDSVAAAAAEDPPPPDEDVQEENAGEELQEDPEEEVSDTSQEDADEDFELDQGLERLESEGSLMSLPSATDVEPDAASPVELLPGWYATAPRPCQRVEASAYVAGNAAWLARDLCLRSIPPQVASLASASLVHLQPLTVGLVGAGFAFSGVVLDQVAAGFAQKGIQNFTLRTEFICTAGNPKEVRDKKRRFYANALQKQKLPCDRACVFESMEALRGSRSRCLCHFPGSPSEKNAAERALNVQNSCSGAGRVNLFLASVPLAQLCPKNGPVEKTLAAPTVCDYVAQHKPELVLLEDSDVAGEEGAETPGQLKAAALLENAGYAVHTLLADPARWGVPVRRPRAYVIGCLALPRPTSLFHGAAERAQSFGPAFESAMKWWQVEGPSVQQFAFVSSVANKRDIDDFWIQEKYRQQHKSPLGWERSLALYCGKQGFLMPRLEACDQMAAAGPWQRMLPPKKKVLLWIAEKSWGPSGRGFVTDLAGAPGNGFCDDGPLPILRKDSEVSSSPSSSSWSSSWSSRVLPLRCGSPLQPEDCARCDSIPIRF